MKPKDCVKQIITNEPDGWDPLDTLGAQFYNAEFRGQVHPCIDIDFQEGTVICYDEENEVTHKFAIRIVLEPISD